VLDEYRAKGIPQSLGGESVRLVFAGAVFSIISLGATAPASASILLDFEGVGNLSDIAQFYNGGTDSSGHHGPNYGVSFSTLVTGLIDQDDGGNGNFANEPSSKTVMVNFSNGPAVLNIAAGFSDQFSFYYSTQTNLHAIAYSDLNGSGNVLAQLDVTDFIPQYQLTCSGDPMGQFCNWTFTVVNFGGIAKSITFEGDAGDQAMYTIDNLALGTGNPEPGIGSAVPEPASWALLLTGFGLAGGTLRKQRKYAQQGAVRFA